MENENKTLFSAGVDINIPAKNYLLLGLAIGIPGIAIVLMLIIRDVIKQ